MTQDARHQPVGDVRSPTSETQESKEYLKTLEGQGVDSTLADTPTKDAKDIEKGDGESFTKEVNTAATSTTSSAASSPVTPPYKVIAFDHNDSGDPYNWSTGRKNYIVAVCITLVINSTMGSAISAGASEVTAQYFGVTSEIQLVLPTSLYLAGYVLGPLFFAPLSESYGRHVVLTSTFILYTAFSLGCALAPTWAGLNVMRLLSGIGASTPISVVGGVFADIYNNPKQRGNAMAIFMSVTLCGALLGPLVAGYISVISWRWAYWLQLIVAGATWPFFLLVPETYGPTLLLKRAKKLRKETGNESIRAPIELEKRDLKTLAVVTLTRPLRMFFQEAIVLSSCLYMATIYAIFYIYLQAFSIIYGDVYRFSAGEQGLTFLPIAFGSFLGGGAYMWWEAYLAKKRALDPPPKWTEQEEYSRVALACFAGPLMVISVFWLAWTARTDVHWIVPVLSSIPFGLAYVLIYIGLINYLVDAYEIYAASALAASSFSRSLFGVLLPFAVPSMFSTLGIQWAVSVIGFISLAMSFIPFVFLRYGDRLRANSDFCNELKRIKAEKEAG